MTTLADVEQRLGEVGEALNRATGGQALCRLDGAATTAKELEGRMAVLMELRRALRRDPGAGIEPVAQRWRDDLAARTAAGASQSWIAYLTGAVAELDVLSRR
jgi:hypothetical protein